MLVSRVSLRDFRNHSRAEVALGERLTVVSGPNGVGKTNLLEAIYFGATARSPRTSNERALVRRGRSATRVALETTADGVRHLLEVGFTPGRPKLLRVDGRAVQSLAAAAERPLVSVFMPERLELVRGSPGRRRAHLDQVIAALWPARAHTRQAYARALAQRNALLVRIRAGVAGYGSLDAWELELARHGAQLSADRAEVVERLRPRFAERAAELGIRAATELRYRARSRAHDAEALRSELSARREEDAARGFTVQGPHRDDLEPLLDGESLRTYGSQGEQRVALLALLFAERDLLQAERSRPPLLLLDDVMSELDGPRRERLAELLGGGCQAVVTTTEPERVPWADGGGPELIELGAPSVAGEEPSVRQRPRRPHSPLGMHATHRPEASPSPPAASEVAARPLRAVAGTRDATAPVCEESDAAADPLPPPPPAAVATPEGVK